MNDYQAFHADKLLEEMRIDDLLLASAVRLLTTEEVTELRAAYGIPARPMKEKSMTILHICPYCGKEYGNEWSGCCGETNAHGVYVVAECDDSPEFATEEAAKTWEDNEWNVDPSDHYEEMLLEQKANK